MNPRTIKGEEIEPSVGARSLLRRLHLGRVGALCLASVIAALCFGQSATKAVAVETARGAAWAADVEATPNYFSSDPADRKTIVASVADAGGANVETTYVVRLLTGEGLAPSTTRPIVAVPTTGPAAGDSHPMSCERLPTEAVCRGSFLGAGEAALIEFPIQLMPGAGAVVSAQLLVEGGGVPSVLASLDTPISSTPPPFGFSDEANGLQMKSAAPSGAAATSAGSHPEQIEFAINLATNVENHTYAPAGRGVKDIKIALPKGLVVNPQAVPECTEAELETEPVAQCPLGSQVGVVSPRTELFGGWTTGGKPLYNMVPPPGMPAQLGFQFIGGLFLHLNASVDSSGEFQLVSDASEIPAKSTVAGVHVRLWGRPQAPTHDAIRGDCLSAQVASSSCPVADPSSQAFLSLPSHCGSAMEGRAAISSWLEPAATVLRSFVGTGPEGAAAEIDGCNQISFEPTITSQPTTTQAEAASGLTFDVHQPQNDRFEDRSPATLKDVTVALPEGLTVNPSGANGLGACGETEIGVSSRTPLRFSESPQQCPESSRVGQIEVATPLLGHKLSGSIYIARPFANPFGSLLALYLAVEDEQTGIVAKLGGRVESNPQTGQLNAVFTENPELPLEDIDLEFFGGSAAVLTTPLTCGTKTTSSTLTPWSTPEGVDAHPTASFQTTAGCSASEAAAPKTVSFTAGTLSPLSGAYSPFVLRIARPDGSQHITGIDTTLPPGLLGKLAGVAYCPESGIAQARSREVPEKGKLEQSSPSCPSSSEVGTVNVTAGSGITPIPVSGHAYLAGPYKGAPLSLVVIVPAVAGPFDLGTVVDRVALNVGEYDARIHAVADPLPTIREGIPLDVRSIELKLDRPSFTLNPTSCEAMAIEGSVSTQAGQSAPLNNRFQVGECGRLGFKPKLALSLKGPTKRTGHPALKAVLTYPKGGAYANIARAQVNLPHSEFLDQGNIGKACTKVLLAARSCPARSIYGTAKAWSPLLAQPLEGPVYLVGGYGYKLPALVAELDGQIRVLLVGKIDTGKNKGIRNTFEAVPDAPVERFVLELKGGKRYGLLENSEDVCRKTQKAGVSFRAQNGKVLQLTTKIANSCKETRRQHESKKHGVKKH